VAGSLEQMPQLWAARANWQHARLRSGTVQSHQKLNLRDTVRRSPSGVAGASTGLAARRTGTDPRGSTAMSGKFEVMEAEN